MKAVIPAAGEGKRFNQDVYYGHKCLMPIDGKPLLMHTLENLTSIEEIDECIVIIGERHKEIVNNIGNIVNGKTIIFCKQNKYAKGIVAAIESATEYIQNDDFIMVLADEFVYKNNYSCAIKKFVKSNIICMIGVYLEKSPEYVKQNYTFNRSDEGFLESFVEKPNKVKSNYNGTGNIIFSNSVLDIINQVKENEERHEKELVDLLNLVTCIGNIESFIVGRFYINMNNWNDYVRLLKFLKSEGKNE